MLASLSSAGVPTPVYLPQAVQLFVPFSLAQFLGHDILALVAHVSLLDYLSRVLQLFSDVLQLPFQP